MADVAKLQMIGTAALQAWLPCKQLPGVQGQTRPHVTHIHMCVLLASSSPTTTGYAKCWRVGLTCSPVQVLTSQVLSSKLSGIHHWDLLLGLHVGGKCTVGQLRVARGLAHTTRHAAQQLLLHV